MGPIAVVCLMLLWPVLGWAEKASHAGYKPGSQTCLYDAKGQFIIPGDLPIHQVGAYVVDCLNRSGEKSKAQDVYTGAGEEIPFGKVESGGNIGIYMGDGIEAVEVETVAIKTAKMAGFDDKVPLKAKCFLPAAKTESGIQSVFCQVYAWQTGKILNLECRYDGCMVTGVLDVHQ